MTAVTKYRAVFCNAHNGSGSHGPERDTIAQALKDRPERSEETLEYLIGIEQHDVTPWVPAPLSAVVEASS